MHVASLELCKDLYELSGWAKTAFPGHQDTDKQYMVFKDGSNQDFPYLLDGRDDLSYKDYDADYTPAYDLGYLLRKLPANCYIRNCMNSGDFNPDQLPPANRFEAYLDEIDTTEKEFFRQYRAADNPEDAACSLCIELFKQGILRNGGV
jgi:hypothetical protein